jgi:hypothetical protein
MDAGEHEALTDLMAGGGVTVTLALPDLVVSSVEVAVMVAAPVAVGVNTPANEMVPPVAIQLTPEL